MNLFKRMWGWGLAGLITFCLISWIAPQQIGVILFKVLQVVLGVVLGYIADRELFKNVPQIDTIDRDNFGAARLLSRAIVVAGVLLALCIGL